MVGGNSTVVDDFSPIQDRVYRILKQQIIDGELEPGTRLVERELAEKLNISRTPIREAMRRLDTEGLIRVIPRKGGVVVQNSVHEIGDLFQILEALEVLAVRLATQRLGTKEIEAFHRTVEGLSMNDDLDHMHEMAILTVCDVAQSPRLKEMIVGLIDLIHMSASIGRQQPGRAKEAMAEHAAIFKAIVVKDTDQAVQLMQKHLQRSYEAFRLSASERIKTEG